MNVISLLANSSGVGSSVAVWVGGPLIDGTVSGLNDEEPEKGAHKAS